MKRKNISGLSMRVSFSLLVLVELWLTSILISAVKAVLYHGFGVTLNLPEVLSALIFGTLVSSVVTTYMGKWIFEPIQKLGNAISQIAAGNFDVRLDENQRFEAVRTLYKNFNQMADELQSTEILQTDFVSNVSHEFKTPINAIEGYATLLQGSGQSASAEQDGYVDRILFNTRRLSKLVSNILLLSKVDNQVIQTNQTQFRMDEQIRQSVVMLEPEWEKKEVEFDVELERTEYVGNETLLLHVWNNLIGNAIKFNPQGGTVKLKLFREAADIVFTVEDEGPGIAESARKHIFDRFYQSDSSHKDEGNGLGLALVKQILRLSDGSITVENAESGGCRFTVRLPEQNGK